ncbi:Importin-11 [Mytilus edulis]|uniref:Importin-11 n=1 Tax=Mytilus edulis TaxID=6550 RepID=A0A8S3QYZ9_MYTED|nr:Importin-11 [Mytilus edulis]
MHPVTFIPLIRPSLELTVAYNFSESEKGQEEIGDSYRYSIKPCTEALFLALFKENRMSLSPVLIEMVHQIQLTSDPNDIMAVLRKDAVYNAVGLSAFDLFDDINFDEWFTSHLLSELTNRHVNYRIIRRRVIWLIGQWMQVLHVISFVIERVGPKIQQYATALIHYLPALWQESAEHNMLRCAILTTLIHLVQQYSSVLVQSLGSLMTDIKTEAQVLVLRVIELVLKTFPKEAPEAFSPLLPSFIKAVLENESESVLGMFLDILSEKIDSITQPEKRKLCALCVTSLLSLNLNSLVIHDDGADEDKEYYCGNEATDQITEHDRRKTKVPEDTDIIKEGSSTYHCSPRVLLSQLRACQLLHGQSVFNEMMDSVDSEIVHQLQELTHKK